MSAETRMTPARGAALRREKRSPSPPVKLLNTTAYISGQRDAANASRSEKRAQRHSLPIDAQHTPVSALKAPASFLSSLTIAIWISWSSPLIRPCTLSPVRTSIVLIDVRFFYFFRLHDTFYHAMVTLSIPISKKRKNFSLPCKTGVVFRRDRAAARAPCTSIKTIGVRFFFPYYIMVTDRCARRPCAAGAFYSNFPNLFIISRLCSQRLCAYRLSVIAAF